MKNFIVILSLILLSGCTFNKPQPTLNDIDTFINDEISQTEKKKVEESKTKDLSEWTQIQEGLQVIKIPLIDSDKIIDTATIFKVNPHLYEFSLKNNSTEPKTIHDWSTEISADLMLNGSYFNENNEPTGGYKINNKAIKPLTNKGENGYTGALEIKNGKLTLHYLPNDPITQEESITDILQSFPTIIIPQQTKGVETNSYKKARRTIMAQDTNGSILIIFTERPSMSLYDMMEFLLASDLNISIAINLDGGPSSGYVLQHEKFDLNQPSFAIPNIITITKRNEPN